jgi:hypothetical protein
LRQNIPQLSFSRKKTSLFLKPYSSAHNFGALSFKLHLQLTIRITVPQYSREAVHEASWRAARPKVTAPTRRSVAARRAARPAAARRQHTRASPCVAEHPCSPQCSPGGRLHAHSRKHPRGHACHNRLRPTRRLGPGAKEAMTRVDTRPYPLDRSGLRTSRAWQQQQQQKQLYYINCPSAVSNSRWRRWR